MAGKLKKLRDSVLRRIIDRLSQSSAELVDSDPTLNAGMITLCREAATEGIVLLRNDGTLPLQRSRVAVFGRVQVDYLVVGYGSGGDVKSPYRRNLLDALVDSDVAVDEELATRYREWTAANPVDEGHWGSWPFSFPEMPLDDDMVRSAASRADAAIVVIGRAAGESRENKLEPGSYYLTEEELAMLAAVTTEFARTIVVLDTGNVVDMAWLGEFGERISAVVLAWQGGMEAGNAVADVLSGAANPSGRLTATIAARYEDYPTAENFGHRTFNNYAEDIFVGYRYFETFAPDRVLFPFGFGLSYTTFSVSPVVSIDHDSVTVTATVTNTGERAGKHVIQAYYRASAGALAQPARQLAGFAKTDLLGPGQSETVTIAFPVSQMASFDDSGATGHADAYVLEAGEYEIFVGADVRSAARVGAHTVSAPTVTRQLTESCAPDPAHPFQRMTLSHDGAQRAVPAWEATPTRTRADRRSRVLAQLPDGVPLTGDVGITLGDVRDGTASLEQFVAQLTPAELEALTRGDRVMNSALGTPGNAGVFGGTVESLRVKGVPAITTTDGPSGIRLAAYASLLPCGTALASTWNTSLLEELARNHGQEMRHKKTDVLLSPGMNIQRDPLCGRNFEYFSEDPVVSGKTASAIVAGIQAAGVAACPKHLACNNQETNRSRNDSRVSQRALREIYLRGFEICVVESRPRVMMTSYNKINGVWAHYNDDLVTTILRNEWGFDGVVITDWWMQRAHDPDFPGLRDNAYRVRGQVDVLMPGGMRGLRRDKTDSSLLDSYGRADGVTLGEMQRSATNVLTFALGVPRSTD
ncbi:glycoside hydrolase family 3 protein [Microbacterium hominis]|uniref:Glycoside hydrolase family 3 C-terminal domain-containing protein n=1 Tax=Microbacterium hominis TaxID=162426 RepID=A0A7D4PTK2_9MICO|nr:glycoside hydrolase family 3 protein [Microbacterium hominis]QKJ18913.1 glycoside hydrolase family 3 C-terminal domain-containing protein [Microbacterium hominis]